MSESSCDSCLMNNATSAVTRKAATIRPGLLDRLKTNSGIKSDEAFARLIGVSRATLTRLNEGDEPSLRTVIGIARAFELAVGEVIVVTIDDEPLVEEQAA